jgi:hypothetical protein
MVWTELEVYWARETTRRNVGVVKEDVCEDCSDEEGETGEDDEYGVEIDT